MALTMSNRDRHIRQLPGSFELQPGFHGAPEDGLCALEAVAWLAGPASWAWGP